MLELLNEEVVNWANEKSNEYAVTFDEAYALCVITDYHYATSEKLVQELDATRSIERVIRKHYGSMFE